MSQIKIKKKYIEFLKKNGLTEILIRKYNDLKTTKKIKRDSVFEINLDKEETETILDELTNFLIINGFDEKEKINLDGEMIEEIIDVFSMHFYEK